jgi:hypothetical protein
MKTLVLSTVCGLALLAVSTISTAEAGDYTAPIEGDRFSYSQIGDIKGEHPLEYEGIGGEHPAALDGVRTASIQQHWTALTVRCRCWCGGGSTD